MADGVVQLVRRGEAGACGYRGAYANRYALPFEDTPFQPDLAVVDFAGLAHRLLEN